MATNSNIGSAAHATFRVRSGPFFITGRGLAVICELVDGTARYGAAVDVELPIDSGGAPLVEPSVVESARAEEGEWPGLVFLAERDGERVDTLRRLLQPGALLTLTERRLGSKS